MTRSIFISGTSSGIGLACVSALSNLGFRVYAGVRESVAPEWWRQVRKENVVLVAVDITSDSQVRELARQIRLQQDAHPLVGVVNNAGIMRTGRTTDLPIEEVRRQFDVNLFGHMRVTQQLLPFLRESQGRVVNVGSTNGRISGPLISTYSATKHALEAWSASLYLELVDEGITVSMVEPGAVSTELWEKLIKWEEGATGSSYLGLSNPVYVKRQRKLAELRDYSTKPDKIADAILHALTDKKPKYRYVIGRDAKIRRLATSLLPQSIFFMLRRFRYR